MDAGARAARTFAIGTFCIGAEVSSACALLPAPRPARIAPTGGAPTGGRAPSGGGPLRRGNGGGRAQEAQGGLHLRQGTAAPLLVPLRAGRALPAASRPRAGCRGRPRAATGTRRRMPPIFTRMSARGPAAARRAGHSSSYSALGSGGETRGPRPPAPRRRPAPGRLKFRARGAPRRCAGGAATPAAAGIRRPRSRRGGLNSVPIELAQATKL